MRGRIVVRAAEAGGTNAAAAAESTSEAGWVGASRVVLSIIAFLQRPVKEAPPQTVKLADWNLGATAVHETLASCRRRQFASRVMCSPCTYKLAHMIVHRSASGCSSDRSRS